MHIEGVRMNNHRKFCCILFSIFYLVFFISIGHSAGVSAVDILKKTGIKGGFIVHLNCNDGSLTADLHAGDQYTVEGLDTDPANIKKARININFRNLSGKVTAIKWDGKTLPYIDNLVNLIVSEKPVKVPEKEIRRVLAPRGIAYIKKGKSWSKITKEVPKEYDDWTHYQHGPDGNCVSKDVAVDFPRHIQWVGSPRWARHHDHMSSVSACVTSKGRVFYIFDEGPRSSILHPPKWKLIARDAFNGVILWKKDISEWHPRLYRLKSGPGTLPRRLVAVDDRVYATLGYYDPVSVLDAASGKIIKTCKGTESTEEIIYSDGTLFLLVNKNMGKWKLHEYSEWDYLHEKEKKSIMAVDPKTGRIKWDKEFLWVGPCSMVCDKKSVYLYDGKNIYSLSRNTGKKNWASKSIDTEKKPKKTEYGYTIVVNKDVLLFSGGDEKIRAFSIKTGRELWSAEQPHSGYRSPWDLFVIKDRVWYGATSGSRDSGIVTARNLKTGRKEVEFPPDVETFWFHHRCYRARATERFLLTSRTGIEFIDIEKKHWTIHHWTRGACLYGIMPANGMIYNPQHPCACYLVAKTFGFNVLAPASPTRKIEKDVSDKYRLFKGPAYGSTKVKASSEKNIWPTYRHDNARSGSTAGKLPASLAMKWKIALKSQKLTPPVVAGKKVFAASIDDHVLYAVDALTGKKAWSFQAGGRIDSPPTVHNGKVIFGSADGNVYALRSTDGLLIWRFRGAPFNRRHLYFEQVESVWPIHGSVLVKDDRVYTVAGRSMFTDGGLRFLILDPDTGKKISETILDEKHPETGKNVQSVLEKLNIPSALPDILSSDGKYIYMRLQKFDLTGKRAEMITPTDEENQKGEGAHLFSPTGFLDDSYWHRTYWVYGKNWLSGAGGYHKAGRYAPSGRILVHTDKMVYGFGRKYHYFRWTTPLEYSLFASEKEADSIRVKPSASEEPTEDKKSGRGKKKKKKKKGGSKALPTMKFARKWEKEIPVIVRGLVLAGDTLVMAGPEDMLDEEDALKHLDDREVIDKIKKQSSIFEGDKGGFIYMVSSKDGKVIKRFSIIFRPVFDGMAAAYGNLYMVTKSGTVICLGKKCKLNAGIY